MPDWFHIGLALVIGVGVAAGGCLVGDLLAWLTGRRYQR